MCDTFETPMPCAISYSPLLDAMTVDVLATPDPTRVHYIIEGVRNSVHAS